VKRNVLSVIKHRLLKLGVLGAIGALLSGCASDTGSRGFGEGNPNSGTTVQPEAVQSNIDATHNELSR
jgi:hypothetical protein